jgi:hypothetical protein
MSVFLFDPTTRELDSPAIHALGCAGTATSPEFGERLSPRLHHPRQSKFNVEVKEAVFVSQDQRIAVLAA